MFSLKWKILNSIKKYDKISGYINKTSKLNQTLLMIFLSILIRIMIY